MCRAVNAASAGACWGFSSVVALPRVPVIPASVSSSTHGSHAALWPANPELPQLLATCRRLCITSLFAAGVIKVGGRGTPGPRGSSTDGMPTPDGVPLGSCMQVPRPVHQLHLHVSMTTTFACMVTHVLSSSGGWLGSANLPASRHSQAVCPCHVQTLLRPHHHDHHHRYNTVMKLVFLATSFTIIYLMRYHKVIRVTYDREQVSAASSPLAGQYASGQQALLSGWGKACQIGGRGEGRHMWGCTGSCVGPCAPSLHPQWRRTMAAKHSTREQCSAAAEVVTDTWAHTHHPRPSHVP